MSKNLTKRDIVLKIYEDSRNNFPQKYVKEIVQQTNRPEKDVMIPTRAVIKFKAGKEMKEKLKDLDLDQLEESSD